VSIERIEKIAKSLGGLIDYKYVKIVLGKNDPKVLIDIPITVNTKNVYGYLSAIYTLMNPTLAKKIKGTIILRTYFKDHIAEHVSQEEEFDYAFETLFFDESVGYIMSKDLVLEKVPVMRWNERKDVIVPYMGLWSENVVSELNFNLIVSLLNEIGTLDFSINDFSKEYLETLKVLKNYGNIVLESVSRLGIAVPKVNVLDKVKENMLVLEVRSFLNEVIDAVRAKKDGIVLSLMRGIIWENIGNYLLAIAFSQ